MSLRYATGHFNMIREAITKAHLRMGHCSKLGMKNLKTSANDHKGPDKQYLALVQKFPLRPIQSAQQHECAMAIMGTLAARDETSLAPGERDYLGALTVLLEDYDRQLHYTPVGLSALELLQHLMQENALSVSDLGRIIGSQSSASLLLLGKRQMSKRVILKLAQHFQVSPALFLTDGAAAA